MRVATSTGVPTRGRDDVRTIVVVGSAHFTSHMLQLALAPLFPIMRDELSVSFTELGLLLTAFYAVSGAGQVLAGVLVDRFGAHRLLIAGVVLQASAIAAMGLVPHYGFLLPLAVAAGLGNSVYHPADLTILSRRVSPLRLGRAFAAHVVAGSVGFAASPLLAGGIAAVWGWRAALVCVGALGLMIGLVLMAHRAALIIDGAEPEHAPAGAAGASPHAAGFLRILAMPVVILAFTYFTLTAFAGAGIQGFAIAALTEGYGATLALATVAVTAYQLGSAGGVLVGGVVADRTTRHDRVAMSGLAAAAGLVLAAASTALPAVAVIALLTAAGFAGGITAPARDLLVRRAAPQRGVGKVFGIVYSGFDVGSLIGPLIYGALLDHGAPNFVFVAAGLAFALAVPTVLGVRRDRYRS